MFEKYVTEPESISLPSIDPTSLYHDDGTVNLSAVEAYLMTLQDVPAAEVSALDELSLNSNSYSFEVNLDVDEGKKNIAAELKSLKERSPLDYAIDVYVAHLLEGAIEHSTLATSETLVEDPYVKLNFSQELDHFLSCMAAVQQSAYEFAVDAQDYLTPPVNDVNQLECIVAIPVAGHQEYDNIYRTLEQFTNQKLPANQFEVVLYLNLPGKDGENDDALAYNLRQTLGEIERFKQDFPTLPVRHIINTYRGDPAPIGTIRADLWGTIAHDMRVRERQEDILVISADADIVNLNSDYLSEMVAAQKTSGADLVTASLRWQSIPGLPSQATANRVLRYQSFLDEVRDQNGQFLHTADANTGISLAAYMAAGGYDRQARLGEMTTLVNKILYYRQDIEDRKRDGYQPIEQPVQVKAKHARLTTHSRRLVKVMALGHSPYSAWDQKLITFGQDDSLRTEAMQAQAAEAAAEEHWKKWLTHMTPPYMDGVPYAKKRRLLKFARGVLGFSDLYR